jgi:hypothetical protein
MMTALLRVRISLVVDDDDGVRSALRELLVAMHADVHVAVCFRLLPFLVGGHRQLALENLALRQQLAVYKRTAARPKLRTMDSLFWVGLARAWTGWRQALVVVSPDNRPTMAAPTLPRVLGSTLGSVYPRPSMHQCRDRRPYEEDGRGESLVGCASHPRGTGSTASCRRMDATPPALLMLEFKGLVLVCRRRRGC